MNTLYAVKRVDSKTSLKANKLHPAVKKRIEARVPEADYTSDPAEAFLYFSELAADLACGHNEISVPVHLIQGTLPIASHLGHLGGSSKSKAKAKAARANGAKGGRPRNG